jgi:hypothetical protein
MLAALPKARNVLFASVKDGSDIKRPPPGFRDILFRGFLSINKRWIRLVVGHRQRQRSCDFLYAGVTTEATDQFGTGEGRQQRPSVG